MDRQIPLNVPDPRPEQSGGDQPHPESPEGAGRRGRSWFRRTLHGVAWLLAAPADWMGWRTISGGATLIGRLYQGARTRAPRDRRFKSGDNRTFDLVGTAFAYGITVEELERRLATRRQQTATLAYATFILACVFVLAWVYVAVQVASGGRRGALLLQFLPFCLLFYLMSFYQALINYQIRTRRSAGWREYLSTEEGFLPRW